MKPTIVTICLLVIMAVIIWGRWMNLKKERSNAMRSIRELLILLDKEIDGIHFRYGLCNLVMELVSHNIISRGEMRKILDYIHVNHPTAVGMEGWNDEWSIKNLYWWPKRKRRPRHKYMKILIENCDED